MRVFEVKREATIQVSDVRFIVAPTGFQRTGLIGWIRCVVNGCLQIDGLSLRRTADGRTVVSFPARRDATGQQHFYVQPLGDEARRDIEFQILKALGLGETTAR